MSKIHRLAQWVLVTAMTSSQAVMAAEWVAEPSANFREDYNDNYRLTNTQQTKVWGTVLEPRLKLSRLGELWDINASGRLRASHFIGEDGLDTTDNFFDATAKRRMERGSFDANASLSNDTTLQYETLDFDTGVTVEQVDRTQRSLGLAGQYMLTETTTIDASITYNDAIYDNGEIYGLLDYDNLRPTLQLTYLINQQTQVFGILSHNRSSYDSDSDQESTTDSLQIGAAYSFSETWYASASAGSRRTKTSSVVTTLAPIPGLEALFPLVYDVVSVDRDAESTGLVFDGSITRSFETGSLSLNASQTVTPSSAGTDVESTTVGINGTRQFSTKLSAGLAVSYYQSTTVGDATTNADSDRYRIAPSLTWRLHEDLALNAGYSYTRVKRDTASNDEVDSNTAFISLGYTWPRMAMSR